MQKIPVTQFFLRFGIATAVWPIALPWAFYSTPLGPTPSHGPFASTAICRYLLFGCLAIGLIICPLCARGPLGPNEVTKSRKG